MLPSVTRSHPLSSQGADHAPCPAGAFSRGSWALSAAPDSGRSPVHPTHASAKDAHLCPPGFSPACQCPPDCLHCGPRRPRQHISELAAFLPHEPHPLLCSPPQGAASSPARLPTAQARCPFTSIRGAPVPPGSGLLKFSPFSIHPVAVAPGQPTTVLPLMLPTFS